jgi:hypothetical protein
MSITVPREELNSLLEEFRKGKKSNFGQADSFAQINIVCEMQLNIHQKHYAIDSDNPKKKTLVCDLDEMEKVDEAFDNMKVLSDKIHKDL